MGRELISIIVPVYNVEEYVEQCVYSILSQTYHNIEILLIDDGSKDKSGDICDQLALSDPRIRVFHKANGGVSDARNFGLCESKGNYVVYIDSDDFVSEKYIQYLKELSDQYDADISCCGYIKTETRSAAFSDGCKEVMVCSGAEACRYTFEHGQELKMSSAWGKLYKRAIAELYEYPVGHTFEDTATTCKYLYASKTVAIGSAVLYAYFQNLDGISGKEIKSKPAARFWGLSQRALFFEEKKERFCAQRSWAMAAQVAYADSIVYGGRSDGELKTLIRSRWSSSFLSFQTKVLIILYLSSPNLFRRIRTIVKKER